MIDLTFVSARMSAEGGGATACGKVPLRTVLLGSLATAEACSQADPVEQAERQLAHDAVDLVLLDLSGPVGAMLSLVGRLRAAAADGVVFIGIMPWWMEEASRVYLSAVVNEVIEAPLRPDSVHRVIGEILRDASGLRGISLCAPSAIGTMTRH